MVAMDLAIVVAWAIAGVLVTEEVSVTEVVLATVVEIAAALAIAAAWATEEVSVTEVVLATVVEIAVVLAIVEAQETVVAGLVIAAVRHRSTTVQVAIA